jgi:hypothetical protein
MAKTGQETGGGKASGQPKGGLDGIAAMLAPQEGKEGGKEGDRKLPPVHLWNPPFCGDIDIRIAADGTWFYEKSPIGRIGLVKLFSSVLKREGEKYFLVTPVEKVGIVVDDAPFTAVELHAERTGQGLSLNFRTNVDEWIAAGPGHALRFEEDAENGGLAPYLHVRSGLWAKVTRALFYDLVDLGEERDIGGTPMFGVVSRGEFFAMAEASVLRES